MIDITIETAKSSASSPLVPAAIAFFASSLSLFVGAKIYRHQEIWKLKQEQGQTRDGILGEMLAVHEIIGQYKENIHSLDASLWQPIELRFLNTSREKASGLAPVEITHLTKIEHKIGQFNNIALKSIDNAVYREGASSEIALVLRSLEREILEYMRASFSRVKLTSEQKSFATRFVESVTTVKAKFSDKDSDNKIAEARQLAIANQSRIEMLKLVGATEEDLTEQYELQDNLENALARLESARKRRDSANHKLSVLKRKIERKSKILEGYSDPCVKYVLVKRVIRKSVRKFIRERTKGN